MNRLWCRFQILRAKLNQSQAEQRHERAVGDQSCLGRKFQERQRLLVFTQAIVRQPQHSAIDRDSAFCMILRDFMPLTTALRIRVSTCSGV